MVIDWRESSPSFSLGWNIAQEKFWQPIQNVANLLKLRFSYGQLGNQNTNQWYPTYRTMTLGILDGGWLQNGTKPNTAKVGDLISTVLTWEKVRTWDIGLDYGLFNNRLTARSITLSVIRKIWWAMLRNCRTVQLSVTEGGMVAEKIVEEGTMVKQGEVIVRLTNPMLNLSILDSEAQLAEKQNFLRNTLLDMEQNRLSLKKDQLQFDIEVGRQKRRFEQYKCLYDEKLVSREEYLQAQEEYELAFNRHNLVVESRKQDSIYRSVQVEQLEESLDNMRRNLVLVRQRGEDLNVKAPVSGQLGLLDVEIGQSIATGTRIGQINVLSDFKVEAFIDEHYIDRVREGLNATFERQDKDYELRVRKVYPEVRDKQFRTDFVFEGERPDNIRAGQTYYINLQFLSYIYIFMSVIHSFFF